MKVEWTNKDSLTSDETTKAILVIDEMPKDCASGCPVKCKMRGINHRPTWCPLKPMPKRMLTLAKMNNGEILNNNEIQYMKGRNDCIDEILGETE